jgi:diketogulonate reductase-like aldo/keto reductase
MFRLLLVAAVAFANMPAPHADVPTVVLGVDWQKQDVKLPVVGAGTWEYNSTEAYSSLCSAFKLGYQMVDTANMYGNQVGVGKAIKDCWTRPRSELFVMTKVPGGLGAAGVAAAHKQNLAELQLDYVDHLMTHFPSAFPLANGTIPNASKASRQEEWRALEAIYATGEARSIGVSHYCSQHIEDVMEIATVKPSVDQIEYHVGSGDVDAVMPTLDKYGIHFMSFSPLCGPCNNTKQNNLINGDLVSEIAAQYPGVTGAQVSLRFIVQQALTKPNFAGVIPKSDDVYHLAGNIDLFEFELSDADMARLHAATEPKPTPGDCQIP